jgi:hypothetical protein
MTITCKHCSTGFTSMIVIQETAIKECYEAFAVHLQKEHPTEALELTKKLVTMGGIFPWLLMVSHTSYIYEPYIKAEHGKWMQFLAEALGVAIVAVEHSAKSIEEKEEKGLVQ